MKHSIVILVSVMSISGAFAQTTPAPAPATTPAPTTSPAPSIASSGKREAYRISTAGLKGQDKRDQMQVCVEQARLNCLKQALEQRVYSDQRRDFIKTCVN